MDPVEFAGTFQAVYTFGNSPELQHFAVRIEPHEDLILRRAAQGVVFLAPLHRRRTAYPEFVILQHAKAPGRDDVLPHVEEFAGLIEHLNADVVAVRHIEATVGVEGDGMGNAEFTRFLAQLAPGVDELAVAVEVDDAGVSVTVGPEDVA